MARTSNLGYCAWVPIEAKRPYFKPRIVRWAPVGAKSPDLQPLTVSRVSYRSQGTMLQMFEQGWVPTGAKSPYFKPPDSEQGSTSFTLYDNIAMVPVFHFGYHWNLLLWISMIVFQILAHSHCQQL